MIALSCKIFFLAICSHIYFHEMFVCWQVKNRFCDISEHASYAETEVNNNLKTSYTDSEIYEAAYMNSQQSTVILYSPSYMSSTMPEETAVADVPHGDWESFDP